LPRHTKIIATVGPASQSGTIVRALIDAGVDCFRLNFSYGTPDQHERTYDVVRQESQEAGRAVAVIQDLQGPKVRVGRLPDGSLAVEAGAEVKLGPEDVSDKASCIPISYPSLSQEVKPGDRILLGDGEVELTVQSITGSQVQARVAAAGIVKDNQGVHLPRAGLTAEAITEKDAADLRLGLRIGVDYVAISFVRNGDDVRRLKSLISAEGARVPVIAKLERREASEHLDDILAASDAVMVARGDLGLELPLENVPLLQKRIIQRANEQGIMAITATQMLESMVESSRHTRAEVSDVANAILDGTDAVMLSAETAIGRYPVQAVQMMASIAGEAERQPSVGRTDRRHMSHAHAMSRAACADPPYVALVAGDLPQGPDKRVQGRFVSYFHQPSPA